MAKQRHVLITGGIQGIGRALVDHYIHHGHQVYIFDVQPLDSPAVASLLASGGLYQVVDIASVASIEQGFMWLDSLLAGSSASLDIVINNAGVSHDKLSLRITEKDWDVVMNVNLKGAFFCSQQALKRMIKVRQCDYARHVIMVSSVVALTGNVGQAHYAASKAGLIALTKSLAREYAARRILINAIAPGYIETAMTDYFSDELKKQVISKIPLNRSGRPEEIAQLIYFLTSGAADYMTGQVFHINGGMLMM